MSLRLRGVIDSTVECGRDTTPHAGPPKVVGPQLMGSSSGVPNPGRQLLVEVRGPENRVEPREYPVAGVTLVEPPSE